MKRPLELPDLGIDVPPDVQNDWWRQANGDYSVWRHFLTLFKLAQNSVPFISHDREGKAFTVNYEGRILRRMD